MITNIILSDIENFFHKNNFSNNPRKGCQDFTIYSTYYMLCYNAYDVNKIDENISDETYYLTSHLRRNYQHLDQVC